MAKVAYFKAALTANGGSNGILTVASTAQFVAGAQAFLAGVVAPNIQVRIVSILSSTTLTVQPWASNQLGNLMDCSAYTTADSATLGQPDQDVFKSSLQQEGRRGLAKISGGQSSVTVGHSQCRSGSFVQAWVQGPADDATLLKVQRTNPQEQQFTIVGDAVATGDVQVAWELGE